MLQMLSQWPRALWQNPLLFLMASVLGGAAVFTYSYEPLHRSKDWKIDYLEDRLRIRNGQVEDLRAELQVSKRRLSEVPPAEEISALRDQYAETLRLAESRKDEVEELALNLRRSRSSRNTWRARHAELLAQIEENVARPEPPRAPVEEPQSEETRSGDVLALEPSPTAPDGSRDVSEQPAISPASPAPAMPSLPRGLEAAERIDTAE